MYNRPRVTSHLRLRNAENVAGISKTVRNYLHALHCVSASYFQPRTPRYIRDRTGNAVCAY